MVSATVTLDHVTAVVANADEAGAVIGRLLGVEACTRLRLPSMDIRSFRVGDAEIHINAPAGPGVVLDHYRRCGTSVHHVALRVADLVAHLADLERRGFRRLGDPVQTAPGVREVFLDPSSTAGLWIQLVEREPNTTGSLALDPAAIEALAGGAQGGGP